MQKKYNVGARLQCAEEKDDYEWWSEDEQQQNQPKKQPLQSLAVIGWLRHRRIRHPAAGLPEADELDAARVSRLELPSVRALRETLAAHYRQI